MFDLKAKIYDEVDNLSDDELIKLHNEYCEFNRYTDDIIGENTEEEINTLFTSPFEAMREMRRGFYNPYDDYYQYDTNLRSFNDPHDVVDKEALTDWLYDNRGYIETYLDIDLDEYEE